MMVREITEQMRRGYMTGPPLRKKLSIILPLNRKKPILQRKDWVHYAFTIFHGRLM
jgi:hypothetical protein